MKPIKALVKAVRQAASFNQKSQAAPAAVLWTDKECQWQAAIPLIKQYLPELVELGDYQLEQRKGPAVWIKCAIARLAADLPSEYTPIVYLPGIARKEMRAIELCPEHLLPLAELQYRGFWWATPNNSRDWTVSGFLANRTVGLELDIAKDAETQAALLSVLPALLEENSENLQGRRFEADDLLRLVVSDPERDLLIWLDEPSVSDSWAEDRQQIFSQTCLTTFGIEPNSENRNAIVQSICEQQGAWAGLWLRFCDIANQLPGLLALMSTLKPRDLAYEPSAYLVANQEDESSLRGDLVGLAGADDEHVRQSLIALYQEHKPRAEWIWAGLGLSPYLAMLTSLHEVAKTTLDNFAGPDVETMAAAYKAKHWQADAAALQAMAEASNDAQRETVADILAVIYTPWLTRVAENFQRLVQEGDYPGVPRNEANEARGSYVVGSQLVFFVDGLRFDVAQQLKNRLAATVEVQLSSNWSALPSLTATAKAAVTPIHEKLSGLMDNQDFIPVVENTSQVFSSHQLKKLLAEQDWQYLVGVETGDPEGRAWVQTGDLDHAGHDEQLRLPSRIAEILDEVEARIHALLKAGWKNIRIVTDHGWLWVPDKLPKAELPKDATTCKSSRCAILKSNVATDRLSQPWYWNKDVRVALAPGVSGFTAGDHYNHGGLSLQECLTPVLNIQAMR